MVVKHHLLTETSNVENDLQFRDDANYFVVVVDRVTKNMEKFGIVVVVVGFHCLLDKIHGMNVALEMKLAKMQSKKELKSLQCTR